MNRVLRLAMDLAEYRLLKLLPKLTLGKVLLVKQVFGKGARVVSYTPAPTPEQCELFDNGSEREDENN